MLNILRGKNQIYAQNFKRSVFSVENVEERQKQCFCLNCWQKTPFNQGCLPDFLKTAYRE